jgi:acetyltransferase-like isoleucine patch superfamily enzyme
VVVLEAANIHAALSSRIDSFCKLEGAGGIYIGELVHIASFCHIGVGGGLVIMDDNSSAGSGAKVISGSNTYGAGHGCSAIAPDAKVTRSYVYIGRNATLYAGAIVLPGCTIGDGAVIAAGAVVLEGTDVPAGEMWAGTPARLVRIIESGRVRARYLCKAEGCAKPRRPDRHTCGGTSCVHVEELH